MKLWMNAKHECAQIYNTAMRTCVRGGANRSIYKFNLKKKKKVLWSKRFIIIDTYCISRRSASS